MAGKSWTEAVIEAVARHSALSGSASFTRQSLLDAELDAMVAATGSAGATPAQTISRELQQLRENGLVEFLGDGTYCWLGSGATLGDSKGVFVVGSHSIYADEPESFYRFPTRWMHNAKRVVGNWIIYQEPRRAGRRGYYAVARVERIIADPSQPDMHLALIKPGSYLEFGRDVPFQLEGQAVERGLLSPDGRVNGGRAGQSIRTISNEDFNRIVGLGLVDEDEIMPRADTFESTDSMFQEERAVWEGPIDRATMLVNRKVRDRQFRKRVLDVYDGRCAFTGMRLINGGGRAEAQAAHIMSVGAGGPDVVNNGIALSGTVHWMFDRGLLSMADDGEILLSRKINDVEGVRKLIHPDRGAWLPQQRNLWPHPRYLAWHRDYHRFL